MNFNVPFRHNKDMKTFFIVLFVILFILFLPLYFKIHFFYNIDKNRGLLLISLFGVTIIFYRLKLDGLKLVLKNKKQIKVNDIDLKNQDMDFANFLQGEILKRLYLKSLIVFSSFGRREDAFLTAMVGGVIGAFFANFKVFVCHKKGEADARLASLVHYEKDKFCLSIKLEIFLTIFEVIISLIIAQIKTIQKRRTKQNGKQLSSN